MKRLGVWLMAYVAFAGAVVYVVRQFYAREISELETQLKEAQGETQAALVAVRDADLKAAMVKAQAETDVERIQAERERVVRKSQERQARLDEVTAEVGRLKLQLQAEPPPKTLAECVGKLELCQTLVSRMDSQVMLLQASIEGAAEIHELDMALLGSNALELVACRGQVDARDAQVKALEKEMSLRTMQSVAMYQSRASQRYKMWAVAIGAFSAGTVVMWAANR